MPNRRPAQRKRKGPAHESGVLRLPDHVPPVAAEPAEGRLGGPGGPDTAGSAPRGRDLGLRSGTEAAGQAHHLPPPVWRPFAHRHVRHEARCARRHPRRVHADRHAPAGSDGDRAPAPVREGAGQVRPDPLGEPPDEEPQHGRLLQPDRTRAADRRPAAPRHAGALPCLWQHDRQVQAGRGSGDPVVRLLPVRDPRRERHSRPDGELPRQVVRPLLHQPGPGRARLPPPRAEPAGKPPPRTARRPPQPPADDRRTRRPARLVRDGPGHRPLLRSGPDHARLAQGEAGLRPHPGTGQAPRRLRPLDLRPELPAGAAADRGRRAVRQRLQLARHQRHRTAGTPTGTTSNGSRTSSCPTPTSPCRP